MQFSPTGLTGVQDAYTPVLGGLLLGAPGGQHRRPPADVRHRVGAVRHGVLIAVALVLVVALVAERRSAVGLRRPAGRSVTEARAACSVADVRA